jgi:hypothetical protein
MGRKHDIIHNLSIAESKGTLVDWQLQGNMPGLRWTLTFLTGTQDVDGIVRDAMTVTRSMGTANAELIAAELACGIPVAYPPELPYRER